jgi:hypothetical protein
VQLGPDLLQCLGEEPVRGRLHDADMEPAVKLGELSTIASGCALVQHLAQ